MARKNNPRNLRASVWSNPMFCLYTGKQLTLHSWTNALQMTQNTLSFLKKIRMKPQKAKKNKKKYSNILKHTRSVVLSSAYNLKIMSLLSQAVTLPVQFQLKKLKMKSLRVRFG